MRELNKRDLQWAVKQIPTLVADLVMQSEGKAFIAGGFIRSIITGEDITDIDIFAPSKEEAQHLSQKLREISPGNDPFKVHETANAFTVTGGYLPKPVQFVHRWAFSNAVDILLHFDFTIAQAVLWYERDQWQSLCCDTFYEDLAADRLIYTKPKDPEPGGTLLRVLKFYAKGYRIPLDSLGAIIARMAMEVDFRKTGRDIESIETIITSKLYEVDPQLLTPGEMNA